MKYTVHLVGGGAVDLEVEDRDKFFGHAFEWYTDSRGVAVKVDHVIALVPAQSGSSTPRELIDEDGDRWTLVAGARYRQGDDAMGTYSLNEIESRWGVKEYIR